MGGTTLGGDSLYQAALVGASQNNFGANPGPGGEGNPTVVDPDGNTFVFPNWDFATVSYEGSTHGCSGTQSLYPVVSVAAIKDRNGNEESVSANCSSYNFTITDTLGRTAISKTSSSGVDTINVSGLSQPYTATWETITPTGANSQLSFYSQNYPGCPSGTGTEKTPTAPETVIQSITLSNGKKYQFSYDPIYGLLNKITYPSGGYVSYAWAMSSQYTAVFSFEDSDLNGDVCSARYEQPVIVQRNVSFDGQSVALQQTFSYSTNWDSPAIDWLTKQTTVATLDEVTTQTRQAVYAYVPVLSGANNPGVGDSVELAVPQAPVEQSIEYYESNGSRLETVTKGWAGYPSVSPPEMLCQLTTLDNGLIGGTFYTYGPGEQIIDKKIYDYGTITSATACTNTPGSPPTNATAETVTTYTSFPATPNFTAAPSILDRPASVERYFGGNKVSEMDFAYDQTPVASAAATQHDETNYGPSSSAPRGNLTTITKQCLQSCTNAVTTYTYDETGQVLSVTDPCGHTSCGDLSDSSNDHTTFYSYTDSFTSGTPPGATNAYLTQITLPATNGNSHIENFSYNYIDGQLSRSTDENGQATTYLYSDPLDRPTESDFPDGGRTTIAYNDTARTVTTSRLIAGSAWDVSAAITDGLGHVTRTEVTSDPAGIDYTDKTYDGLGELRTVTNTYRSTGDATYGVTSYSYDGLGRVMATTHPDGSTIQYSYAGRAKEIIDEGNGTGHVVKVLQTNILGELVSVCEGTNAIPLGGASPTACGQDLGATGFLTAYTYDGLGNLETITQTGIGQRTFAYDSLSKLLTAYNPETGQVRYTYDAKGNLSTKTDARSVVTTFSYDDLGRVVSNTYSDSTPSDHFYYDACPTGGCPAGISPTNPVGRLMEAYNSNAQTWNSYDAMGRVTGQWQCTPLNCGSGYYMLPYHYDLMGNTTSSGNGQGVTFSYNYNAASQLTSLTSSWNDSNHPSTLLSAATYNALALETSALLGNGLTESLAYGNRGQLESKTVSNGSGSTPATGLVAISGTETTTQKPSTPSNATLVLSSSCGGNCGSGTVTVTIGGVIGTADWTDTIDAWAAGVAQAAEATGLVSAIVTEVNISKYNIALTSYATGTSANYSLSCSGVQCPSSMTGGSNGSTVYDSGTIRVTANGHSNSVSYGQNSTTSSIASALASAINADSGAYVTAYANGEVVSLKTKASGAGANYSFSTFSGSNYSSTPSFTVSASGSLFVGGTGGYGFALSYAPDGDVIAANDSANANWVYTYDDFNRLSESSCVGNSTAQCPGGQNTQGFAYKYDQLGNRWQQNLTAGSGPAPQVSFTGNGLGNNNRVDGYGYDASGDETSDGTHTYSYDAAGRIIRVDGGATAIYVYDAMGDRVEKTTAAGSVYYSYDLSGRQIVEVNSSGAANREEIYAGGKHVATYANSTSYFDESDWLGTERARSNFSGTICETLTSLPFGDDQMSSTGGCGDPSPLHFTGKQRDNETGFDYFGARYDASSLGRFVTPDWSATVEPVPYAKQGDPQTLNLYIYVTDNPTTVTDPTGHAATQTADPGPGGPPPSQDYESVTAAAADVITCVLESVGCSDAVVPAVTEEISQKAATAAAAAQDDQSAQTKNKTQTVVVPSSDQTYPSPTTVGVVHREVVYTPGTLYPNGNFTPEFKDTVTLSEKQIGGNSKPTICSPSCSQEGGMEDEIEVANTKSTFKVEQRFEVNGKPVNVARLEKGKVVLAPKQVVDATAKRIIITPEQ